MFNEWPRRLSKHVRLQARAASWESLGGKTLDVHVPEMTGQFAEVPKNASRNIIQHRNRERIVDDSVPEVEEELIGGSLQGSLSGQRSTAFRRGCYRDSNHFLP